MHRFLLRTPAHMIGVWLPDAVGDRRPQNLPGTWDQYPNWRLPVADAEGRPVTLEDLAASPRLHALLEVVRTESGQGGSAVGDVGGGPAPGPGGGRDLRTAPPGARVLQVFATFAPWTRRTLCAPVPWPPVRR